MAKQELFEYIVEMRHNVSVVQKVRVAAANADDAEYLAACKWKDYPVLKTDNARMVAKSGKVKFNTRTLS